MIAKRDDAIDSLADLVLDGGATDADGPHDAQSMQALAFAVWAFECGRDISLTQGVIEARTGVHVPLVDLRHWRRDGHWGDVAGSVHQTLGNSTRQVVNQMSGPGSIVAVRTLLDMMHTGSEGSRIRAAMTWLDRFGHPVMVRGELFNGLDIGVSDLDDDQLEAQWLDYAPDAIESRHGDTSRIDQIRDTQLYQHARYPV